MTIQNFFSLSELTDMPVGTGTLYVSVDGNKAPDKLRREERTQNATETEESKVVQFLALGGHSRHTGLRDEPTRVISGVHAGPGQQVFGYTDKQRCDLLLYFGSDAERKIPTVLHYHNYHGYHYHYTGHVPNLCPKASSDFMPFSVDHDTEKMDTFRFEYASAMTAVRPTRVRFEYSFSTACHYFHGRQIPGTEYTDLTALLYNDPRYKDKVVLPYSDTFLSKSDLKRRIRQGTIFGFVTVKGGEEVDADDDTTTTTTTRTLHREREAGKHFGYCVQNYGPRYDELSSFTREQIKSYYGFGSDEQAKKYVEKLPARTLNSSTFHSEETVSTSYLRWLMLEQNFDNFEITHFIRYAFTDDSKHFLLPLLQARHRYKQEGNKTAAECVKLVCNGGYG